MVKKPHDLIIVNGLQLPPPVRGIEVISTQAVDGGRNANGAVVGQLVGRRMYKLNNIQFAGLSADDWAQIRRALEPFYVPVTFTNDLNERMTLMMYPSDTTGKPFQIKDWQYDIYENCKFNLIDCGW